MDDEDDNEGGENSGSSGKMVFKLLSRDNKGRFETRNLLVPENNSMAVKVMRAKEESRLDQQRRKEQILQLDSLSESNIEVIKSIICCWNGQ